MGIGNIWVKFSGNSNVIFSLFLFLLYLEGKYYLD